MMNLWLCIGLSVSVRPKKFICSVKNKKEYKGQGSGHGAQG